MNSNGFLCLEVVEHACGMATLQMGEYVSNVSNGIDTYSIREPLGVCAGICPFNFPAMIPLWVSLLTSPLLYDFVTSSFLSSGIGLSFILQGIIHFIHTYHLLLNILKSAFQLLQLLLVYILSASKVLFLTTIKCFISQSEYLTFHFFEQRIARSR